MPIIPALKEMEVEDQKFKVVLGNVASLRYRRLFLKKKKKPHGGKLLKQFGWKTNR